VGTNWQLKEIGGTPAQPEEPQRLLFETETELSGYDGCNGFSATWETILGSTAENESGSKPTRARPKISIEMGFSTLRGCSWMTEEERLQQSNFMTALRQEAIAFSFSADEQELTLYQSIDGSPDMPIVMTRIPIPPQPHERLIGTSWVATDIAYSSSDSENNELTPILEDHPVTMSFERDTFFGSTGTNKYAGDITMKKFVEGGVSLEFEVTNVARTSISFQDNTDPRLLQEHAWMDIIEAADDEIVTIPYTLFDERIGDTDEWTQVLLLGSFQAPLARFVPLPEGKTLDVWGELQPIKQHESEPLGEPITPYDITELAGSNWLATNIRGTRISHDVSLFFESNTRLRGHGGCNDFEASWVQTQSFGLDLGFHPQLRFIVNGLSASYMYCEGIVGETEIDFFNGLQQGPITYETSSGGELTLWDTVVSDDGRQTRGELIAKFDNAHVPSWGGQSLVGMTGEEAKAVIEAINPSLDVVIMPPETAGDAAFRLNRVRIWVDKNGNVTREPQRG
jgi:heat shock protein HslJ